MPRIPDLPPLNAADALDLIPILDISTGVTKYVTVGGIGTSGNSFAITQEEIDAGVDDDVVNLNYAPGNVLRYGADASGVNDSAAAFQAAMDSNYKVEVPAGEFSILSTITILRPKMICFAGRHSFYSGDRQRVGEPVINEKELGEQSRIMLTTNINLFNIQSQGVWFFGGLFDARGVSDHTGAIFYYPLVTNGSASGGSTWGGWDGGAVGWTVIGNYDDVGQVGIGTKAIHLDVINSTTSFAFLYFHHWDGVCWSCDKGFYASERPDGLSITLNNCDLKLQANSTRQAFYNGSINGMVAEVRHQARHVWQDEDEINTTASVYSSSPMHFTRLRFYDFGKPISGGLYTNQKTMELRAPCSFDELDPNDIDRAIEFQGTVGRGPLGLIESGINHRDNGQSEFGVFVPELHDIFWPWALAATEAGNFTWAAYQGITDTVDAVSDMVFANQSGVSVDITSAAGELPSGLLVGAIFEISDHSVTDNNGQYRVTASITDGYTCDKLPENYSYEPSGGYVKNPADAVSEPATATSSYGAMTDDSVTEGVSVSTDITFGNTDNFWRMTGTEPQATWNAQAVTDGDYVELFIQGSGRQMSRMYIFMGTADDKALSKIQVIRKTTIGSDNGDNIVMDVRPLTDPRTGIRHFDIPLGGGGPSKVIIRFIGLDQASSISIGQIYTAHTYFQFNPITMYRDEPGTYYGQLIASGERASLVPPIVTTTNLGDASHYINTSASKVDGAIVSASNTGLLYRAMGNGDTDNWQPSDGGAAITPS